MRKTRYTTQTIGRVVSMRCRRSPTNANVVVIDNEQLDQVYVYDYASVDDAISYLQDEMNLEIVAAPHAPVRFLLLHHLSTGDVYYIRHEEDESRDDFHAFFAPRDDAAA